MGETPAQENCACGYPLMGVYAGRCPECGRNIPINRGGLISQYSERHLDRRLTYYLYPDTLVIHGRTWQGTRFVSPVPLATLDPEIYTVWQRQHALKVGLTLIGCCVILLGTSFLNHDDKMGIQIVVMWTAAFLGLVGLILTVLSVRMVEYAQFYFRARPRVSLGRVGPNTDKFNDFVAQVRKTILATQRSKS